MASQSLLPAVAITIMSFLYTTALPVTAVLVEHTFVVSMARVLFVALIYTVAFTAQYH
jgi:hypothetical protein